MKKTSELYEIGKINLSIQSEKREIKELERKSAELYIRVIKIS